MNMLNKAQFIKNPINILNYIQNDMFLRHNINDNNKQIMIEHNDDVVRFEPLQ